MILRRILPISIILSLILTACGDISGPSKVKIAVSLPLGLDIGPKLQNAAQLAIDQANGKAGDLTVELLVFNISDPDDSPVSPVLEREAATKAAADPSVVAYVGGATSDLAREALPILNEAGMTQVAPYATWPGLTKPGFNPGEPGIYYPTGRRTFFRIIPSDEVQGEVATRWADRLGVETVYLVNNEKAYGRGIAGIFEVNAPDVGLRVVGTDSFESDSASPQALTTISEQIIEADPHLLYLGASIATGGKEFLATFRELNQNIQIMVPDGMVQDQLIDDLGKDMVEGIYGTHVVVPVEQLKSARDFVESYQAVYGEEPPLYAVTTYEAVNVILSAIEQADEPTREGVLEAMKNLGEYSGILGEWHFDERGDISLTAISGMQIRDGEWAFVKIIE